MKQSKYIFFRHFVLDTESNYNSYFHGIWLPTLARTTTLFIYCLFLLTAADASDNIKPAIDQWSFVDINAKNLQSKVGGGVGIALQRSQLC